MSDPVVEALQKRAVETYLIVLGVRDRKTIVTHSWRCAEGEEFHAGRSACYVMETGELLGLGGDDDVFELADRLIPDNFSSRESFYFNAHLVMCREFGKTPWGTAFNGQWVVRDIRTGELIDNSMYVNDLIDKYNFPSEG